MKRANTYRASAGELINSRHAGIDRNKRCLLAYLNSRMEKMREMRWQFGAVLPEEIKLNLSEPELEYFSKYNKTLATYMRAIGTDLTSDMAPPKSLYVEVRVREDHGEVETADGEVVLLKAGSQHHLPRSAFLILEISVFRYQMLECRHPIMDEVDM